MAPYRVGIRQIVRFFTQLLCLWVRIKKKTERERKKETEKGKAPQQYALMSEKERSCSRRSQYIIE